MSTSTFEARLKVTPGLPLGAVIPIYDVDGAGLPTNWALCDGTLGTPDLRARMIAGGSAVGAGTAAGSTDPSAALTHAGAAVANHSAHAIGQASAHSTHVVGQATAHLAHDVTQPATHTTHAPGGGHSHDEHTTALRTAAGIASEAATPSFHDVDGEHAHDAHPAHTGMALDAHSAHTGGALDAHSAHTGAALDAHSVHSVTQPSAHSILKHYVLAFIKRIK